jgi:hypothetical protein
LVTLLTVQRLVRSNAINHVSFTNPIGELLWAEAEWAAVAAAWAAAAEWAVAWVAAVWAVAWVAAVAWAAVAAAWAAAVVEAAAECNPLQLQLPKLNMLSS